MIKSDFEIIENSKDERNKFGLCYGSEEYHITTKDIEALLNGKTLATTVNCGEYSIFITLDNEV